MTDIVLALVVIVLAVGFDFTNGFHDAANAIATAVSTRALRPRAALVMAALMNMIGAMLGTAVAHTIATDIVDLNDINNHEALSIVLGALLGAIAWNLITWWFGLPSSSSHALIGGLAGAGLAAMVYWDNVAVQWAKIVEKVIIPMVASPVIGFSLAFLLMVAVMWIFKKASPHKVMRRFRYAQIGSSAMLALGHGLQDAQKTMGVMFMATMAVGWVDAGSTTIPIWIKLLAACAISAGTYAGGFRIMRTLGRKVIEVDPAKGFVAELVGAIVLWGAAYSPIHAPISTTHTITTAIMGVGATKRLSAVRWGVAKNIVAAWVLTLPAAATVAAGCFFAVHGIVSFFV
ncbi:MAG: inorganic phosphate transporter [Bifidobacteriaceae bacterium]|nr:inorganic phosphate transporter [Bifidobacteriaceae bacterium]